MEQPDPTTDPQTDAGDLAEEPVEDVVDDGQARLWLRAITASVEMLGKMAEADSRVQHAVNQAMVAACERIGRLCRSDLGE
jgi:hypothetical protein